MFDYNQSDENSCQNGSEVDGVDAIEVWESEGSSDEEIEDHEPMQVSSVNNTHIKLINFLCHLLTYLANPISDS